VEKIDRGRAWSWRPFEKKACGEVRQAEGTRLRLDGRFWERVFGEGFGRVWPLRGEAPMRAGGFGELEPFRRSGQGRAS